jgi:hypothetical protein
MVRSVRAAAAGVIAVVITASSAIAADPQSAVTPTLSPSGSAFGNWCSVPIMPITRMDQIEAQDDQVLSFVKTLGCKAGDPVVFTGPDNDFGIEVAKFCDLTATIYRTSDSVVCRWIGGRRGR